MQLILNPLTQTVPMLSQIAAKLNGDFEQDCHPFDFCHTGAATAALKYAEHRSTLTAWVKCSCREVVGQITSNSDASACAYMANDRIVGRGQAR